LQPALLVGHLERAAEPVPRQCWHAHVPRQCGRGSIRRRGSLSRLSNPGRRRIGIVLSDQTTEDGEQRRAWAGDWAYAAYALKELGETLERIGRGIPNYQGQKTTDLIGGFSNEPMKELDQAIKASSAERFNGAYAHLTQSAMIATKKRGVPWW
jgi:hypothetical protein